MNAFAAPGRRNRRSSGVPSRLGPVGAAVRVFLLLCAAASLLVGCSGPVEEPGSDTLGVAEAERLVRERFPGSQVEIREIREVDGTLVASATMDGSEVELRFGRADGGWILRAVGREGVLHTVDTLQRISDTMAIMREIAAGLSAYRVENGSYPAGELDRVLEELVEAGHYGEEETVTDAWGTPFRYRVDAPDYVLASAGADGDHGTEDDILLVTGRFVRTDGGQG